MLILTFQNMHIEIVLCPSYPFSMSIKQKTTNTGKDMGKEQPLFTACGRVCRHYGNQCGSFAKKKELK